jgi:hypothetical protein
MIQFLRRFRATVSLLICITFLVSPAIHAQLKSGSCHEYRGTLGNNVEIGLSLYGKGQELEGLYFYKKHFKDISLAGRYTAPRDISLAETDSTNKLRGTFLLHFPEHDPHFQTIEPLQAEILRGKWVNEDGKTTYDVYLQLDHECSPPGQSRYAVAGATNDEVVEKNAQAFYHAVLSGNRSAAAKYVSYPATFFEQGKQKQIDNAADFLKYYEHIFTTAFVAQISQGIPHHMFANSQGIMLADGKVWFDADGKAKHFNNQVQ